MGPARIVTESLTRDPELENSQGHVRPVCGSRLHVRTEFGAAQERAICASSRRVRRSKWGIDASPGVLGW